MTIDTTSANADSLMPDQDDPLGLTGPPSPEAKAWVEQQKLVQRRSAEASLSSPLYRQRAEKMGMEEYFRTYSSGGIR